MNDQRELRRKRIRKANSSRKKVLRRGDRARLAVFRSRKHFYIQAVDDAAARTICAASTLDPALEAVRGKGGNISAAKAVGELIADRLKSKGIENAVFDRGGNRYHGRIGAAATAAREKGRTRSPHPPCSSTPASAGWPHRSTLPPHRSSRPPCRKKRSCPRNPGWLRAVGES